MVRHGRRYRRGLWLATVDNPLCIGELALEPPDRSVPLTRVTFTLGLFDLGDDDVTLLRGLRLGAGGSELGVTDTRDNLLALGHVDVGFVAVTNHEAVATVFEEDRNLAEKQTVALLNRIHFEPFV